MKRFFYGDIAWIQRWNIWISSNIWRTLNLLKVITFKIVDEEWCEREINKLIANFNRYITEKDYFIYRVRDS